MKDLNPAYRQSWIILIMIFPLFGGVLYYLIGNKRPIKHMRENLEEQEQLHSHEVDLVPDINYLLEEKNEGLAGISKYLRDYANAPLYMDDPVRYYPSGESMMDDLVNDLKKAKKTIFVEFFIVEYGVMFDQIFDVLIEKANEGVDVRFIYDGFGTLTRLPEDFEEYCKELGIKAMNFNPVKPIISMVYNTRDHRKFIIIDNEVAYTGGLNIADEYINEIERFGYWKDNMIRVEGPAVWNYTLMFLNMWEILNRAIEQYDKYLPTIEEETDGFVLPFPDGPFDGHQTTGNVYLKIISSATKYVYITTPYLILDNELLVGLKIAAMSGIDVRIILPHIPDKKLVFIVTRSYYRELIGAGVKIYEYTPGFIHTKSIITDDIIGIVGTANFDFRSLYLHFEDSCLLCNNSSLIDLRNDFLETVAISHEIKTEDLKKEGMIKKFVLSILKVFSPLM